MEKSITDLLHISTHSQTNIWSLLKKQNPAWQWILKQTSKHMGVHSFVQESFW